MIDLRIRTCIATTFGAWMGLASLPGPTFAQDMGPGILPDTPELPNVPYRVHDGTRPQPPMVAPGASNLPLPPPADAIELLAPDAPLSDHWEGTHGEAPEWEFADGVLTASPKPNPLRTKDEFGDCQIHLEWRAPAGSKSNNQNGSNSGLFIMGRYEIQILSSFENRTYPDGQAGAIYGQTPPMVNASRAPGEWQSYDIAFTAPRFTADGRLESPACVTVIHNGAVIHHHREILGPTKWKTLPVYEAHPPTGPLHLQYHNDPVQFRNLWVRPLLGYDN
jgi:hypothetical protein